MYLIFYANFISKNVSSPKTNRFLKNLKSISTPFHAKYIRNQLGLLKFAMPTNFLPKCSFFFSLLSFLSFSVICNLLLTHYSLTRCVLLLISEYYTQKLCIINISNCVFLCTHYKNKLVVMDCTKTTFLECGFMVRDSSRLLRRFR